MSLYMSLRAVSRFKQSNLQHLLKSPQFRSLIPGFHKTGIVALSSLSDPNYRPPPPKKARRFFLKFLFLTLATSATCAGLLYVSKSLRDILIREYPPSEPILAKVEKLIGGWYSDSSKVASTEPLQDQSLPFLAEKTPDDSGISWYQPSDEQTPKETEGSSEETQKSSGLPTLEEVIQMTKERAKAVTATKTPADIDRAVRKATQSVQHANASLGLLETATRNHIEALREAIRNGDASKVRQKMWDHVSRLAARKDNAQEQANAAVSEASAQLESLRSVINQCKLNEEFLESDTLPEGIAAYGDLRYDLDGSIQQVRKLQNELQMLMRYRDLIAHTHETLQNDLDEIQNHIDLDKSGSDLSVGELNSLIVVAHSRIGQLRKMLAEAEEKERARLNSALEAQRRADEEMIADHVQRELAKERTRHEIERLRHTIEAREQTDREVRQALARHSDHLSHMLRLKQEEMEHQFTYRLREALAKEKTAFEAALSGWIQRMKAIEDVVDGRAELDRLAKETQALWIACEALACCLSSARPTTSQVVAYSEPNVTGPLTDFVEAVKEAASTGNHPFALAIVETIPSQVVSQGVWMERGLKERFEKVYRVCRRVALVDETGGSLWTYALSWLQSVLVLDVFGRKYLNQIPWLRTAFSEPLLEGNTEVSELGAGLDTFCLLRSSKAALSMDRKDFTESEVEPSDDLNDADDGIELAVRLLGQLRGQARIVAADWLADARLYLEARQAAQALLAYAAARGMSTFQKRL